MEKRFIFVWSKEGQVKPIFEKIDFSRSHKKHHFFKRNPLSGTPCACVCAWNESEERKKKIYNKYFFQLVNALATVRSVNKTDALTLLTTFGTLANIVKARPNTLALCPGFGLHKAQKLHKVLHESFLCTSNLSNKKIKK